MRSSPSLSTLTLRGFTLVELLTVICLVFMLLTLVSVGTSHLVQAAKLSEAVAQVESMLRLAAQRAGIENCEVEVRFYEIDTGAGEGMRFAAMQTMCYRIETDPAAAAYISPGSPGFSPQPVAVSELQRLPSGVVVHEGLFSTLLTDPSRVPDPATAEVDGLPSRVRRVRFLPGGGTDLGAGKKWCVLLCRSQDAAVTSLPANYAVLVIDPETARCSLFRPQ
ncbi:Verru_Chthon cassette protein D [Verrucomicrobium sp. BvORR034]|uniref:Verru_Chthon cassette protein D n=1 Tax=Verrucomicrobium sp. BvORR034 TaxID=1396418 RepID=UPI002240E9DB|nr:Verru_Chthon cassette protein D [Verrucomicrobium sp. BvORR034]